MKIIGENGNEKATLNDVAVGMAGAFFDENDSEEDIERVKRKLGCPPRMKLPEDDE